MIQFHHALQLRYNNDNSEVTLKYIMHQGKHLLVNVTVMSINIQHMCIMHMCLFIYLKEKKKEKQCSYYHLNDFASFLSKILKDIKRELFLKD